MKRIYLFWIQVITLSSLAFACIYAYHEHKMSSQIREARIAFIAKSIGDAVGLYYIHQRYDRIEALAKKLRGEENFQGFALCDMSSGANFSFPENQKLETLCNQPQAKASFISGLDQRWTRLEDKRKHQLYTHSIHAHSSQSHASDLFLILSEDISSMNSLWLSLFFKSWIFTLLSLCAVLMVISSQTQRWIQRKFRLTHYILRSILSGKRPKLISTLKSEPLAQEMMTLFHRLNAMMRQHRVGLLKPEKHSWLTPLRSRLQDQHLVVISNREPYIHMRRKSAIELIRPASGLVSALEPVLKEFGGLWMAHGSGSADFEFTNSRGELEVPPVEPCYTLKRVKLSQDEEAGYYYGFSNEGLWPLCHQAYQQPTFRHSDWLHYQRVNEKFARLLPKAQPVIHPENQTIRPIRPTHPTPSRKTENHSLILIQDYHFALLPRMLRMNPSHTPSRIGLFWHIPWPNAEVFGICPWNKEILRGMLGADVIGFHTQVHCNNFLESCNRYLEARINWERFSVTIGDHETLIKSIPIGIDTPKITPLSETEINQLKKRHQIHTRFCAVGVDRVDYTKGLIERVAAVERFLEKYPEYQGQFTLLQVGSPSRTQLAAYQELTERLTRRIQRVNARFGSFQGAHPYQPIVFLQENLEWNELQRLYQVGDVCLVTSLHDGMNLVAKEYVWCQQPERGALILSPFTGASREFSEAMIVNPYSTEDLADALAASLRLSPEERAVRMNKMREKIKGRTALHWASDLIESLMNRERSSETQTERWGLADSSWSKEESCT